MSNPVKGEVSYEVNGKNYTFKLGTNAQVMIEKRTGMSMAKYLKQDRLEDLGTEGVRLIFWAGLLRNHPELTEDMAGDLIDDIGPDRVAELFMEAFDSARVKESGAAPNGSRPQKAKEQIGMNS